ncbi:hypothetical protein SAMN06297422_1143 [Lachnospiraceae bacterium]|nr:hypothetical protein SAMN06297422_1143 [Lachnospiraceae bacterium]
MMNKTVYDVCIIGSGASGIVAAIESSRRGLSSVVVDKNKKPCKKLYATGNGRCNLTNDIWDDDVYYGNEFVDQVYENLYRKTGLRQRTFILDYFNSLGIKTINLNGYYYPRSLQASSVCWALLDAARNLGVEFINDFTVTDITEGFDYFEITGNNNKNEDSENDRVITAKNVVLAIGGMSGKGLGEAEISVTEGLLSRLSIDYSTFSSGLAPVELTENLSSLAGVRLKAEVRVDNHTEDGEIQINENGLSGIVIMNMSGFLNAGSDIHINVMHKVDELSFTEHFNIIKNEFPGKKLISFLNGYINDKLASYFIDNIYGEFRNITLADISESGIINLYRELTDWTLKIKGIYGFEYSQATAGGIKTPLIDAATMKLKTHRGLFATGEITDVIGKCGGYNLTYAFITGYLAGNSIEK